MKSSYQHLPGVDPENSENGGRDPLVSYIETFYFSENSIKIIQINFKEKRPPLAHPEIRPYCCLISQLLCYCEEADRCLNQGEMNIITHLPYSTPFTPVNQPLFCCILNYSLSCGKYCLLTRHPMSCFTSSQGCQIALLLHPVNGVPKW